MVYHVLVFSKCQTALSLLDLLVKDWYIAFIGPIVYRLGQQVFNLLSGVRLSVGSQVFLGWF